VDQISEVSTLKEQIEFEIIMIDARRNEILELEAQLKERELWAESQGMVVKGLPVRRPDAILEANFDRMGRLIAPQTREAILMNRLEEISRHLDQAEAELQIINKTIAEKTGKTIKPTPVEITEDAGTQLSAAEQAKPAPEVIAVETKPTEKKAVEGPAQDSNLGK